MSEIVTVPAEKRGSYVEWAAVLAGAITASALSFVLLTAGAAVGLSMIAPYEAQSPTGAKAFAAAFWLLFVPILSLLVGGYVAGRMRGTDSGASRTEEIDFRDGVHGLLVWSVSIIIGGMLAYFTASTAVQTTARLGSATISGANLIAPSIDTMLRTTTGQQPGPPLDQQTSAEVTRTVAAAVASGQLSVADKSYLGQVVAQRTGLGQPEAEKRVDDAFKASVKAIDTARKAAVAAGLGTVTALLFGLAAAWYAAQKGGRHRDESIPPRFGFAAVSRPARLR